MYVQSLILGGRPASMLSNFPATPPRPRKETHPETVLIVLKPTTNANRCEQVLLWYKNTAVYTKRQKKKKLRATPQNPPPAPPSVPSLGSTSSGSINFLCAHDLTVTTRHVTCDVRMLEQFFVVTVYVPNSGDKLVRLKYRTEKWDAALRAYVETLEAKGKPVMVNGDLNVAHL